MIAFLLRTIFLLFTAVGAYVIQNSVTTTHPNVLIYGGNIIKINEAPYHVSISENNISRCAGVILSKDYVLTTAHCAFRPCDGRIKILAGSSLRNSTEGSLHSAIQCHDHENYYLGPGYLNWDKSRYIIMTNDLSLIKISPAIEFDEKRQPIVMFEEAETIQNSNALITGWTYINGSEYLTTKTVYNIPSSSCEEVYKSFGGIPAGQICASYPEVKGKTGCVGVSGDPLMVDGRLAGILSWGNGCVKSYGPGVYTEIAYYRRWIDETMKNFNHYN